MSKSHEPYPNERPGFRYRRTLGESLTRALTRFVEANADTPIGEVTVALNARDGKTLFVVSLTTALHALQFNQHVIGGVSLEDACEAVIYGNVNKAGV